MFSLVLSPGYHLSDNSEGLFWRGKGGVGIYKCFCKTKTPKPRSGRSRFLLIKRNQISQASEFSAVHARENARAWDYWNYFFGRATIFGLRPVCPQGAQSLQWKPVCLPSEPMFCTIRMGWGQGAVSEGFTSLVYWNERWHSLSTCSCFSSWNSYLV